MYQLFLSLTFSLLLSLFPVYYTVGTVAAIAADIDKDIDAVEPFHNFFAFHTKFFIDHLHTGHCYNVFCQTRTRKHYIARTLKTYLSFITLNTII